MNCGPLNKPDHGEIIEQVAPTFGNRIVFECKDKGYEMKGSRIRTCQSDGQWSGSPTTCESKYIFVLSYLITSYDSQIKHDFPYLGTLLYFLSA